MFTLNGTRIKNPSSFRFEPYMITKANRVASGDMVMDFIALKRKFVFTYEAISSRDLDLILDILWRQVAQTRQCFINLSYPYNNRQESAVVYAGSIPHDLHRGEGSVWVWKNVSFSLIER